MDQSSIPRTKEPRDLQDKQKYPTPLGPGFVRLIHVERLNGPGEDEIPVLCSLEIHKLEESPPSVALSYTWGTARVYEGNERTTLKSLESSKTRIIAIDGVGFNVTPNLYDAFILRLVRSDESGYFWVDSICINQVMPETTRNISWPHDTYDDIQERNQQVSMMTEIFAKAYTIIIWLGNDENDEVPTVIFLCDKMKDILFRMMELGQLITISPKINEPGVLEDMGLPSFTDPVWRKFVAFWERRWFWRAWCVQEVAVHGSVNISCGESVIEVTPLFRTSDFLWWTGLSKYLKPYSTNFSRQNFSFTRRIGEAPAKMNLLYNFCRIPDSEEPPFFEAAANALTGPPRTETMGSRFFCMLLQLFRALDCTDGRDKIDACLGLLKDIARTRRFTPPPIEVDYARTEDQIYLEVTTYIMEDSGILNFLCLANDPQRVETSGLPSWVTDFSIPGQTPILLQLPQRQNIMGCTFKSSVDRNKDFRILDRVLRVRALFLGRVAGVGDSHEEMENDGQFERTAQLLLGCPVILPNGQGRVEALWRTMITDTVVDFGYPADPAFAAEFRQWLIECLVLRMNKTVEPLQAAGESYLNKIPSWQLLACSDESSTIPDFDTIRNAHRHTSSEQLSDLAIQPLNQSFRHMASRRLFKTEDELLGIGPLSFATW